MFILFIYGVIISGGYAVSLTSASSFSGACCPRFQMVNLSQSMEYLSLAKITNYLVVDLINHLVEGLDSKQFHLENLLK